MNEYRWFHLRPKTDPSQNICFPFKWGLFTLPNEKLILLWGDCHSPADPKSNRVLCLRPCGFQPYFPHLSHSSDQMCVCVCVCMLKQQAATFLVVQWFRLQASTTRDPGSIPGQGSSTWHLVKPENKLHIVSIQNCMLSHSAVSNSLQPHAPVSMGFPSQEYWSELPFPPPGIFPTQVSNPGLLHCRQILYHLSHQGSPQLTYWLFQRWPLRFNLALLGGFMISFPLSSTHFADQAQQ